MIKKYLKHTIFFIIVFFIGTSHGAELEKTVNFAGQWPYQPSKAMAVDTDRKIVFLGDGEKISILDDNLNLITLFTVTNNGQIGGIFFSAADNLLYVACGNDGFCILDVSDPANPFKTSDNFAADEFMQIYGETVPLAIMGVYVENQRAYLACGWAGVKIVDVTDPENPLLIVHFLLQGAYNLTFALDFYASGDYLWVADLYNGIHVFDIKDPEHPEAIYAILLPGAHDLTADNNYLYTTSEGSGLKIYDISDPKNPPESEAGFYLHDGLDRAVRVNNNFAYIAYAVDGLQIVDVTDKSALFHDPSWTYTETDAISIELLPGNDSIFITDSLIGMQKLDVSDKSNIIQSETYDTPADAFAIDVQGDYIYVVDDNAGNNSANEGLRIIEISTDFDIQFFLKGFCSTPGKASDIYVSGDYAYIADKENGLQIISITDKANPEIIGSYDTPGLSEGIFVAGTNAYMADGDKGLAIVNISDKSDPKLTASYDTDGYATDIIVSGDYAYMTIGQNGLAVIDISDPKSPNLTGSIDTPGFAEGLTIDGDYAYIADGEKGLSVIDISDKTAPELFATYDTPGYAGNISVTGDFAYVADGTNGVCVINISDPAKPVREKDLSYDSFGRASDIASGYFTEDEGLFAFIADGPGGIVAINLKIGASNESEKGYGSSGSGCFIKTAWH